LNCINLYSGDSNAATRRELQAMHAEPVEELESRLVSFDSESASLILASDIEDGSATTKYNAVLGTNGLGRPLKK